MTVKFLKKQPRGLCQPWGGHALGKAALGWSDPFLMPAESQALGKVSGAGTVVVKVRALCGLDL